MRGSLVESSHHGDLALLPTAFKQGDVGIHLHIQYDPENERVIDAKTYEVPNVGDEKPPPGQEVLQQIDEKAAEVMQENDICRQNIAQVLRALRSGPKLPKDLFGPQESGASAFVWLPQFWLLSPMASSSQVLACPGRPSCFL
mmetsp:Transcript_42314/g.78806  ORF Transcript_42314/g.78806 Transcript_42314/m.78806 type:complete len:143 (+) Transcript_42314:78-506(+)